jgi:hypothetical protein
LRYKKANGWLSDTRVKHLFFSCSLAFQSEGIVFKKKKNFAREEDEEEEEECSQDSLLQWMGMGCSLVFFAPLITSSQ